MGYSTTFVAQQPICSEELTLLRGVLDRWCAAGGMPLSSPAAAKVALELIDWYQFGLREPEALFDMIRPITIADGDRYFDRRYSADRGTFTEREVSF